MNGLPLGTTCLSLIFDSVRPAEQKRKKNPHTESEHMSKQSAGASPRNLSTSIISGKCKHLTI